MRLLQIVSSVDPRGGGVAEGVLQCSRMCVELGHPTELLSLDPPDASFVADYPLKLHALGPGKTGFAFSSKLAPWLREHSRNYDAIIVNGLWQYHGLGTWLAIHGSSTPYFVYTHGMLDPWFKRTYPLKHLKKWVYWLAAEYRLLRDARAVLFTCEEERLLARQSFWLYKVNERVAAFGTRSPPSDDNGALREAFFQACPEMRDKRFLLFLGRIHVKKGCDILIEAFARVAASDTALHLVIAGPDQSGWQSSLEALALELGVADRVTFPGMLGGDIKWGAFHASEAHVLPSHQENFGIAVSEALGCGSPVLISDKVNIWREIVEDGAGFVSADTVEGTAANLRRWLDLSPPERLAMKAAAVASFNQRFTVEAMARSLVEIISESTRH